MKFMNIASGSSGNVSVVTTDNAAILVDAGISLKKIEEGLKNADMSGKDIDAVVITHEHSDHIKGLGVLSRRYHIPIYATAGTIKGIGECRSVGMIDDSLYNVIESDVEFSIKDLTVTPRSIWHDAYEPVCFSFTDGKNKVSVATDLGNYNDYLVNTLSDSDVLLIESNHDIRMLEAGPYPYDLKRRILGEKGHLSNETAGKFIKNLLNDHIKTVILGHLSSENNFPELAFETVKNELKGNSFTDDVRDFDLHTAFRDRNDRLYEL
ncbi:MBL fold metallo-hydrolase [Eubacterium ruminantium]|uniref:MBL fold metallo-hydrolase n=2 Tax=Eubacterium ruminantium TaxID=42322 RepID=UPI0015684292|nr:MBL fold metallo-hydrolase [Eubacterium ruminantium]